MEQKPEQPGKKGISRREFLKNGVLFVGGMAAGAVGKELADKFAGQPGVTPPETPKVTKKEEPPPPKSPEVRPPPTPEVSPPPTRALAQSIREEIGQKPEKDYYTREYRKAPFFPEIYQENFLFSKKWAKDYAELVQQRNKESDELLSLSQNNLQEYNRRGGFDAHNEKWQKIWNENWAQHEPTSRKWLKSLIKAVGFFNGTTKDWTEEQYENATRLGWSAGHIWGGDTINLEKGFLGGDSFPPPDSLFGDKGNVHPRFQHIVNLTLGIAAETIGIVNKYPKTRFEEYTLSKQES